MEILAIIVRLGGARVVARGESLVARLKGGSLGVSKWLGACGFSAPSGIFSPARCKLLSTTNVGIPAKPCSHIEFRVLNMRAAIS